MNNGNSNEVGQDVFMFSLPCLFQRSGRLKMKSEGAGCVKQKWESKRVERRKKGAAKEEEKYGGFIAEEMI